MCDTFFKRIGSIIIHKSQIARLRVPSPDPDHPMLFLILAVETAFLVFNENGINIFLSKHIKYKILETYS
jgi:hypothetical protein